MDNTEAIRNLSQNLHDLRCKNGLSAELLAKCLNVSVQMLETLENGILPEDLTVENLIRLEKQFGVSLKDLFLSK